MFRNIFFLGVSALLSGALFRWILSVGQSAYGKLFAAVRLRLEEWAHLSAASINLNRHLGVPFIYGS